MNRLRIVLDTNVIVSAALQPGGLEGQIIELIAARVISLYISPDLIDEYQEVLQRPKFTKLDPDQVARLLTLLADEATVVSPQHRLSVSPDDSDNRFLECAETAEADFLITGNKKHFPERWKKTRVVNARQFFEFLENVRESE